MKKETPLKNFYGKIIGYIEEDERGNKIARDFYRKVVGKYNKATDTTRDFYGKIISKGDTTSALLYNKQL